MPISDLDNVLLLVQRTGDVNPVSGDPISPITAGSNGIVMINAERIWNKYVEFKSLQPQSLGSRIFDHYFMITAEELIIAVLAARVTFSAVGTAVRVNLSDRAARHAAILQAFRDELVKLESQVAAFSQPLMAPILAIEPVTPPLPGQLPSPLAQLGLPVNPFVIDANSPLLFGSPYWTQWRRW